MTNLPVSGKFKVTCEYGRKGNRWSSGYHKGIDLVCDDRNIYCTCDGVVRSVGYDAYGWGQYVRVDNGQGRIHIFCHFVKDSVKVKVGQKVNRATILGTMGSTGNSTGVHLHFQIEDASRKVYDPTEWLGIPNKVGSYNSKDYQLKEGNDMKFKDKKRFLLGQKRQLLLCLIKELWLVTKKEISIQKPNRQEKKLPASLREQ